jgi:penicillin-binding protein 1B
VGLALVLVAGSYLFYLTRVVSSRFESGVWAFPSKVYSTILVLRPGLRISEAELSARLERMGYRSMDAPPGEPGQYRTSRSAVEVYTRDFALETATLRGQPVRVRFSGGSVSSIRSLSSRRRLQRIAIEPEVIATLHGEQREDRTVLPLSEFPEMLVQAVVAAEDRRFYEHHGLDPLRILAALWQNIREGDVVQGGSTITQQTVKNVFLGPERTLSRKLREALMAMIIEARYSKEKILEVYLNEIYLGQRSGAAVCGFGEASRFYFGKDVADLDLSEVALLVGLIPSPATNNPFVHPERARARGEVVLRALRAQSRITEEEFREASGTPPALASGSGGFKRAPHFVELVASQLRETYPEEALTAGGLRIFTTLDTALQSAAETSLREGLARLEKRRSRLRREGKDPIEGALVALRPGTGDIVALVGGRNFSRSQFNRVVQAHRQPGSLFKPLVYMAGFARSHEDDSFTFTPASLLDDSPLEQVSGGKVWRPANHDNQFRGWVSVRRALVESLNVPTVRASQDVGLEKIVDLARLCGIESPLQPYPSIALGSQEVTPLEMATAYAVIANGGRRVQTSALLEVQDRSGRVLEKRQSQPRRIVSAQAAYLTLNLLRGVVDRGTASAIRRAGLRGDIAGKTGTTNDERDSWFIGMTPDLLTAVWVGFDDNAKTGLSGSTGALQIWIEVMKSSGRSRTEGEFPEPPGLVRAIIDPATGGLAVDECPQAVEDLFLSGTEPTEECGEHESGLRRWFRRLFRSKARRHEI